ncbi:histidine phosphatase family protein, partial [Paraglaciecola sp.]|nr:histidine phosphatase family protein [Paraglaciecola sp.]
LLRAQDTLYEILRHNSHCNEYVRIHDSGSEWYEHFVSTQTDTPELKIYVSQKLNERYYGDLQGLNKDKAIQQFGAEQVHIWRRSYDIAPPNGESLAMTAARTIAYYQSHILLNLKQGRNVLICAHGNSLRAIIMFIEKMTEAQIETYELKTGCPHIYEFNAQMKILNKKVLG